MLVTITSLLVFKVSFYFEKDCRRRAWLLKVQQKLEIQKVAFSKPMVRKLLIDHSKYNKTAYVYT